ncbi:protein ANTAGONIST OF LIKE HETEROCHROMATIN PROTEIN 1-like [Aphis craccivora]|uniref:Protein ANTAGONIST OF LIKE HETEROCHROMATIN PROTEIN 1-like n=1 Tax=Aphis craccivora TaxID=307492 RepID=A0A6G0W1W4_APHCR|nr:protein ANTAGONIST OF LIKE HETEROCHROMATIN PROTEIN 1-like [Aphis craccivora]
MSSIVSRRNILRRIIHLMCAEIAERLIADVQNTRKRKWVRDWISKREQFGASALLLKELAEEDHSTYRNIMRISQTKFDELLQMISPAITKINTPMRNAIPSNTKLEITLRYFASGDSLMTLEYLFRVPHNTISKFLPEVLKAIYNALSTFIKSSL